MVMVMVVMVMVVKRQTADGNGDGGDGDGGDGDGGDGDDVCNNALLTQTNASTPLRAMHPTPASQKLGRRSLRSSLQT